MESAVMAAPSGLRTRLQMQRSTKHHHTYPRSTPTATEQALVKVMGAGGRAASQHDLPQYPHLTAKLGARISREAVKAWSTRVGGRSKRAPADALQLLFNDLNLYPTKTQVFEMLVCARQCARRTGWLSMSFGEFCLFASHLRRHSHRQLSLKAEDIGGGPQTRSKEIVEEQTRNLSKAIVDNAEEQTKPTQDAESESKYEVFLGGSCNPTTWRTDIAIPTLEKMGISYFNPQVAEWSLDLMEQEHTAKRTARVLFFVLDAKTRATAAAVEVAHLAASGRPLVIVLQQYKRGQQIGNDTLSDQEYVDLSRGQAILQEVAERKSLPVFNELAAALRCTQLLLRGSPLSRPPHNTAMANYLIKLKRVFDGADIDKKGFLDSCETLSAIQIFTGIEMSSHQLEDLVSLLCEKADQNVVDFELFCTILAEIMADSIVPDDIIRSPSSVGFDDLELTFQCMARAEAATLLDSLQATPVIDDGERQGEGDRSGWSQLISRLNSAISGLITKIEFNGSSKSENTNPLNGRHGQSTYSRRRESNSKLTSSAESGESKDSTGSTKPARKLSVFIPKVTVGSNGVSLDSSSSVLTPQSSKRLESLAEAVRDAPAATRDVYLGGSCVLRTCWREETVIPILEHNGLTYYAPAINDYNRMFSAPPSTPAVGGRFTFDICTPSDIHRKHERSSAARSDSDQPEKRPKYSQEDEQAEVDLRPFPLSQVTEKNRLSASDFYKISDDASPAPFRGMYDERQVCGSRVLLFGVTKDTRCLAPMVLAAHCVGTRPKSLVLCIQLLTKVDGLSEQAVKDYNRGRLYLKDLAQRSGVPVFDDLKEATKCVVRKIQHNDF